MSIKSVKEQFDKIAPDLEILEFNEPTATVEQAANVHNVEPGQIVKTIALVLDKPILLMTAGDVKIDNKIAYNLDIKFFYDDNYLDKIKGIKCWFVGCLRYDDHPSHASYKEVIDWTKKVNANQTFLSHMTAHIDYETEFKKLSNSRVYPAYDGLRLTI